ncbi:MAG: CinA family nicotinamide mononucleotide deamidase-related protein [Spirochaetes bacterium]|nr:CinA family nicotinamide mononucleotide deamidase-related protein [Spirochaetota bacterium]
MSRFVVLSTGNEIIYGNKADTNAAVISTHLRRAGFDIVAHVAVGDGRADLATAVRESLARAEVLVMTGGLGPTDDDLTIQALQDIFHYDTEVHGESLERMRQFFQSYGRVVTDEDLRMVTVPSKGTVISNTRGLAPGFILEQGQSIVVALPGVPHEMEAMLVESVMPFLTRRLRRRDISTLTLSLVGCKESEINSGVLGMGIDLGGITWGMTAEGGVTSLYFTTPRDDHSELDAIADKCRLLFGDSLLAAGHRTPEDELLDELGAAGMTVAVAESCTGGLIAKRLTDIPGASRVFMGGVVCYSNESKVRILGVDDVVLRDHGAVSEPVAAAMARGVRERMAATVGIATTGIAGPGGGSDEKPVGTVCFGIAIGRDEYVFTRHIGGDRERVRRIAAITAVDSVRRRLLQGRGRC